MAFLLALLFVQRFVDLLKIITAFTVGHTLTVVMAVLGIVRISPHLVECGVALTIMYVAAENLWTRDTSRRWMLTFLFGLIHGFGFASVLRELGLPSAGLARSLVSFNVGVEAGQIAIVAMLWPILLLIHRRPWAPQFRLIASIVILAFGAIWFVQRSFGLRIVPWA